MSIIHLETDYLIIGCGASAMAFADVILAESDATVLFVDKHHKPGGHWNDAYPFVTLHQPSAFYGVKSKELSKGMISRTGNNKGLQELATGAELIAYYEDIMEHTFLPTGRAQYYPMSEFTGLDEHGAGAFHSLLSGQEYSVKVNCKVIDATFIKTSVPSTHKPNFAVADNAEFITVNALPLIKERKDNYVVIGGGKTGIDAILWLLEKGTNPDDIRWITTKDAWFINRGKIQPSLDFFDETVGGIVQQMDIIANAECVEDIFNGLEESEVFFRLDTEVKPTAFLGATITEEELSQLRRVKNILRKGHVTQIKQGKIFFSDEIETVADNSVFIDCSANAIPQPETNKPVFNENIITLQFIAFNMPTFSASLIAHLELNYESNDIKNEFSGLVPPPKYDIDWIIATAAHMQNQMRWAQEPALMEWIIGNRLDAFTALLIPNENTTPEQLQLLGKLGQMAESAGKNIPKLMAEIMSKNNN